MLDFHQLAIAIYKRILRGLECQRLAVGPCVGDAAFFCHIAMFKLLYRGGGQKAETTLTFGSGMQFSFGRDSHSGPALGDMDTPMVLRDFHSALVSLAGRVS